MTQVCLPTELSPKTALDISSELV
jgi:hypothetical protein